MQDRPRFTGTLIISTLIHFGTPFLAAMLLSPAQLSFENKWLVLICYTYVPFALSGCVVGLHPHLIRPVLAAIISSTLVFVVNYMHSDMLAAPAIVCAFIAQKYKIVSPRQGPPEQHDAQD